MLADFAPPIKKSCGRPWLGPKNRFWDLKIKINLSGIHPTLKLIKQKLSEILQDNVPNFYFAEIQKMTKLGPKNRFWDLKIKINLSGIRPNLHPSFFEIQT